MDDFVAVLFLTLMALLIFIFGMIVGESKGRERYIENEARYECETHFNRVEYKNITGECLRFFSEEK